MLTRVAIELRLSALKFILNEDFLPTASHMELPPDEFEVAMRGPELRNHPGHYAPAAWYTLSQLCVIMKDFTLAATQTHAQTVAQT